MTKVVADSEIAALAASALHHMRGGFAENTRAESRATADANLTLTAPPSLRFEITFAHGKSLELELIGSGAEPAVLWNPLLATIRRFAQLRPDWDSYGAKPLSPVAVQRVLTKLLPILLHEGIPEVAIVPTRDGGLQFEWHRRGIDVEIRVPPQGPMEFLVVDPAEGVDEEIEGSIDEGVILSALQRMSQDAN